MCCLLQMNCRTAGGLKKISFVYKDNYRIKYKSRRLYLVFLYFALLFFFPFLFFVGLSYVSQKAEAIDTALSE